MKSKVKNQKRFHCSLNGSIRLYIVYWIRFRMLSKIPMQQMISGIDNIAIWKKRNVWKRKRIAMACVRLFGGMYAIDMNIVIDILAWKKINGYLWKSMPRQY